MTLGDGTWNRDYWTIAAMRAVGGGFVRRLAEIASAADPENLARIKAAWPEYWADYEVRGRRMEEADHA